MTHKSLKEIQATVLEPPRSDAPETDLGNEFWDNAKVVRRDGHTVYFYVMIGLSLAIGVTLGLWGWWV